jgi:hypothetical protein
LETPRALENAVRIFGTRIHGALERTHVFITSREDAWRALPDQTLIEQYLPYGDPEPAEDENNVTGKRDPMLKLFRLAGLTEDEISLFASHYGIGEVGDFVEAIKRSNLLTLAERPFDLKALIRVWIADHKLGSRFDVLQRMIGLQLEPISAASAPVRIGSVKARDDRIDPRVLLPGWSEAEIDALLHTGLFDDIVYTSVRFRHREIRELLSAEWANDLLCRTDGRAPVERLFFRDSYGEEIIVPRTRPTLTWLILLDNAVRDKALALAPEIASEGGDPSRLPLDVRREMLCDIVQRIASKNEG